MLHSGVRTLARLAGFFYLVNIVTSLIAFSGRGGHRLDAACGWAATVAYVSVTIVLYVLFRPVSRILSLIAAVFSLAGCLIGLQLFPFPLSNLIFFGVYCVLLGYLILRSSFLPRFLGVLMTLAGIGWLTFVSPGLAKAVAPYPYIAGGVGEGLLTLWLLILGVNEKRWKQRVASADVATAR